MKFQDPLEEINLGTNQEPRITYISSLQKPELKKEIIELLQSFKDCFAWDYTKMQGLSWEVVEHRLPIKPEFRPFQQPPRRMSKEVELKVKDEIQKLFKGGFIRPTRYAEWISNIVPVMKKNGKLRVCVNFRDLNLATPKDVYVMPVADIIDATARNKLLSFMDDFSGYN